jgi:pyruvate,water dikinase
MDVIDLAEITPKMIKLVGGKAAGLGAMIAAGERVPEGFCLTTAAHSGGTIPEDAVLAAYHDLGEGPVAVRSSGTAEDLPEASFAGQQDTFLEVVGDGALLTAIDQCWRSLDSDRAVAYRAAHGLDADDLGMGVVVQRMIDPAAAGVMFTANPITGTRTETVVDAVPGLGTGVVDGSMGTDHYLLPGHGAVPDHGCLTPDQLLELWRAGRRLQRHLGRPQDIEWAYDAGGTLWLLQSRPITTLFPLPPEREDPRVYLEAGHMQGLRRPVTPMGMSVLEEVTRRWVESLDLKGSMDEMVAAIGGRLYIDLTQFVRNPRLRAQVPEMMKIYGPGVARGIRRVLEDPRYGPCRTAPMIKPTALARVILTSAPGTIAGVVRALARPAGARARAFRDLDLARQEPRIDPPDAAGRIAHASQLQDAVRLGPMMRTLPPLWAALLARGVAEGLLRGVSEPGELDAIQRGMPYNVTTEMDLQLWSIAQAAAPHRELLLDTAPAELAARYRNGELPDFGLAAFLDQYGVRGAAEVDVGVARWAEDPTTVFAALAGYLQVTDPEQAPPARFARAAAEAEAGLDRLVGRATRTRPRRARLAGFLLRRSRVLSGLRELPKFIWLFPLAEVRRQLLAAGAELAADGRLEQPADIMFLTLAEAAEAARGADHRAVITERRDDHERETRRRQVPGLLLSDGTIPDALPDDTVAQYGPDVLVGLPAAAGTATGTVRVVHHPAEARIQPGDILVAPTTDPGWTPLFMTIAGLVTETGSPIAHGPTVAREYGIPAVICVPDATTRLRDGQMITIDGATGLVRIEDPDPAHQQSSGR